jgi:uncharacterized protein (DUF2236 family)
MVTRSDLEAALADLAAEIDDPLAGIHGPGSLGWRYGREAQNFLGAGRAALMQLAHAPVARAIESHSRVLVDVRGRFQRTFDNVFAMTFGDLDHAIRSARRVHNVHVRITGEHSETGCTNRGCDLFGCKVCAIHLASTGGERARDVLPDGA